MSSIELATAWVKLVPSVEGISDKITKEFMPGVSAAGKAGDQAGGMWGSGVKKALGAAAIGAGVIAAFKGLYDVGGVFDDVTDTIRVGTGLQGEALDGLVTSVKNIGTQVPAEFEAIGTTVADLNTRLGLSGETLETVASQYLEAGRILNEDVDIGKTTAAFSAFKIEGDAVEGAMDSLFQVSQATGVGMNELAAGVQANAPALQNLGFGFEDSISLLGSLDKAGLNSTQMMAAMSKGLVTLAKDGEEPEAAFERVTGELQGFVDTGDTAAALDLASQIFGTRGASQFVGALQSGVLSMDDLMAATGATGDTILGVGEETMDFSERWQTTMNTAMTAIEPLASAVFDSIGEGLKSVMPLLQDLGSWMAENPAMLKIAAGVVGFLAVAFIGLTAATWAMNTALLGSPITWIVLAVVALIAAIVALVMNWDSVVSFITDIWAGFIDWIVSVIDGFVGWWNGIWGAVGQFFSDLWSGLVSTVTAYITAIRAVITAVVMAIQSVWNSIWSGISSFFSGIWNGIVSAVKSFGNIFKGAFSGIAGFVKSAFAGVLGAVKGPINAIIGIVNSAIRALNGLSVSIPDWVPVVGGQTFGLSLPTIPQLAAGATILPRSGGTLAVLAEAGRPESVVDTGLMNRALEEGLGGSGTGGARVDMPVTINMHDRDERVFLRRLGRELNGALA